jgi:hypothetical protein
MPKTEEPREPVQHNLDDAIILIAKLLVHRRRVFEACRMVTTKLGSIFASTIFCSSGLVYA